VPAQDTIAEALILVTHPFKGDHAEHVARTIQDVKDRLGRVLGLQNEFSLPVHALELWDLAFGKVQQRNAGVPRILQFLCHGAPADYNTGAEPGIFMGGVFVQKSMLAYVVKNVECLLLLACYSDCLEMHTVLNRGIVVAAKKDSVLDMKAVSAFMCTFYVQTQRRCPIKECVRTGLGSLGAEGFAGQLIAYENGALFA
jgi:hypothetical protein